MQYVSIPACYFPSTALFLDDSRDFLLNFVLQLDESVAYRIFDNPQKALDYIHNKHCELELLNQPRINEDVGLNYLEHVKPSLNQNLAAIHAEVYNPHRFSEISVVVVDYAMPGMNGLEFCRRIENNNIKKILLTGQADEKKAVEAFNEGLIHRYVKKSDAHARDLITKNIYELQFQYFLAMSESIERMLSFATPRSLQDKGFIEFFLNFIKENCITEYYLADNSGSFFMLDDDANTSLLIVKDEKEMQALHELALAKGADESILSDIASGKKIPGLWTLGLDDLNHQSWLDSLVPAHVLQTTKTYYYAHLKENHFVRTPHQKILSYHRYLDELDAEELLMN